MQNSQKNLLIHYIDFGVNEGKSPSPFFDPAFYRARYKLAVSKDPFVHYLTVGINENHQPCQWFDPEFYQQKYLSRGDNALSPLKHYQDIGRAKGFFPNAELFALKEKALLSIIVPVYNVSSFHLDNCIRSVVNQSYPLWELCLLDDCSSKKNVRPLLEYWEAKDSRIKLDYLQENSGIATASNQAASLATGDYLGFLDNDDELAVECLSTLVQMINNEKSDLYYTDEDLIGEDGSRFAVFNKPDFNAELLLCHNYITHFVLAKTTLFEEVGGFDPEKDGAQDFDLLLKLSEKANKVVHIPEVLYHWRASESSTSINHEQKSYADEAGRKSVKDALKRRGIPASVEHGEWKFFYTVKKKLSHTPLVSILIRYRTNMNFRKWLLHLVQFTSYPRTEFCILLDSSDPYPDDLTDCNTDTVRLLSLSLKKSQTRLYNAAVQHCAGEYIVFLDAGIKIQNETWLERLLEQCMSENVAMVGGKLDPVEEKQGVSTVPDLQNTSDSYYAGFIQDCSRHMNGLQCTQNVCSLSWACMMTNRNCFLEFGGFNADLFPRVFADIDLCFRMGAAGYTHVYSPLARGQWTVSDSRGENILEGTTPDRQRFQNKWKHILMDGDPFYNLGVVEEAGIDLAAFRQWYAGEG